jgi:hypothetical protein
MVFVQDLKTDIDEAFVRENSSHRQALLSICVADTPQAANLRIPSASGAWDVRPQPWHRLAQARWRIEADACLPH